MTSSVDKSSLKLTPMGCPDCNVIFSAKDEMMRHFGQKPHKLSDGISINRCPGTFLIGIHIKDFIADPNIVRIQIMNESGIQMVVL